jgi:hypothetical protein
LYRRPPQRRQYSPAGVANLTAHFGQTGSLSGLSVLQNGQTGGQIRSSSRLPMSLIPFRIVSTSGFSRNIIS